MPRDERRGAMEEMTWGSRPDRRAHPEVQGEACPPVERARRGDGGPTRGPQEPGEARGTG